MFTGLIEAVGTVSTLQRSPMEATITIKAPAIATKLSIGDSVAVNGSCLTVITTEQDTFTMLASNETLQRTALHTLVVGSRVNLERALQVGSRLAGHIVLGHVDGVGHIRHLHPEGQAIRMEISAPETVLAYVVPKGSVAVDGISLTVADLGKQTFSVALIPHTLGVTTLEERRVGDPVNLEADILGKYVVHLLRGTPGVPMGSTPAGISTGLSVETLRDHGFL